MVKMEDAVIARFEHAGHKFELLVDPDLALELKRGNKVNFDELLAIDTVFKDAKKGEEASEELVEKTFKTLEINEIAVKIITQGHVQLTTEQKREMLEQKHKELVNFIASNALNPQTKVPHPPARIEKALGEAKVQVDILRSMQEQLPDVLKELKKIIPISMQKLRIAVKIPAGFAAKASPIIFQFNALKQEWQSDGSLVAVFELPVGLKSELFSKLNHLTHGSVETRILEENEREAF